jgi:hypothetical protein
MPQTIDHDSGKPIEMGSPEAARLARLAWLLDSSIPIPGTGFRIGLDALIGLVPGIGDLIGVLLSSYIVKEAWRMGAPKSMLLRMAFNVAVEGVIGAVPFLGDLFDMAWKANQRNLRLLRGHHADARAAAKSSRAFVGCLAIALLLLLIFVAAVAAGIWQLVARLFSA